ncbi:MAG: hypothetical protein HZA35_03960 [Parcubacteria group bacterium]|nr:hypothetical protein [Parcubacteria group bacterium]
MSDKRWGWMHFLPEADQKDIIIGKVPLWMLWMSRLSRNTTTLKYTAIVLFFLTVGVVGEYGWNQIGIVSNQSQEIAQSEEPSEVSTGGIIFDGRDDNHSVSKDKWIYVAGDGRKWSINENPPGANHCHFTSASCAAEARATFYYYPCEGHFVGEVFYEGEDYDIEGKIHKMWRVVCCSKAI